MFRSQIQFFVKLIKDVCEKIERKREIQIDDSNLSPISRENARRRGLFLINFLPPNETPHNGKNKRLPNGRASLIGNRSDRAEDNSHGRTKGRDIRAWHR